MSEDHLKFAAGLVRKQFSYLLNENYKYIRDGIVLKRSLHGIED